MIVAEEITKDQPVSETGNSRREATIRAARAHLSAINAGKNLEQSGVKLFTVAGLAGSMSAGYESFFKSTSLEQTVLLRDYFKKLLEFAEATGDGEVVLSTVGSDNLKLAARDSGTISFLHDLLEVDIAVKRLESNTAAKSAASKPNLAGVLRKFKEQVERGANEVATQFVA